MVAKMNLSYYEKSNLPKQNNMIVHLLGCNGERLCFAGNSAKEEVKWKEKAHDECKVKMDEIWFAWCWLKLHRFNDGDMDGLEVLDDFKVLKINMVHFIIMQVDLTLEEVKKEFARLKWIKFNDRCCVD